jgi:hypothetical protein
MSSGGSPSAVSTKLFAVVTERVNIAITHAAVKALPSVAIVPTPARATLPVGGSHTLLLQSQESQCATGSPGQQGLHGSPPRYQ